MKNTGSAASRCIKKYRYTKTIVSEQAYELSSSLVQFQGVQLLHSICLTRFMRNNLKLIRKLEFKNQVQLFVTVIGETSGVQKCAETVLQP